MIKKNNFLTIAATDTSGGAGIQQDLKVAQYYDFWGLSVITANTAQSLNQVFAMNKVKLDFLKKQLDCVFHNFEIDTIKIGVIPDIAMMKLLPIYLKPFKGAIVLDPVFMSSSGFSFVNDDFLAFFLAEILPLISVITPNRKELEIFTGKNFISFDSAILSAEKFCKAYKCTLYLKGGHFEEGQIKEALISPESIQEFSFPRMIWQYSHGTGCAFSSALAINMYIQTDLINAINESSKYVRDFFKKLN